jgi:hypothetical protein
MRARKVLKVDVRKSEARVQKTVGRLWSRLGFSPPEAVEPLRLGSRHSAGVKPLRTPRA